MATIYWFGLFSLDEFHSSHIGWHVNAAAAQHSATKVPFVVIYVGPLSAYIRRLLKAPFARHRALSETFFFAIRQITFSLLIDSAVINCIINKLSSLSHRKVALDGLGGYVSDFWYINECCAIFWVFVFFFCFKLYNRLYFLDICFLLSAIIYRITAANCVAKLVTAVLLAMNHVSIHKCYGRAIFCTT